MSVESEQLFQQAETLFRKDQFAEAAPLFRQAAAKKGLDLEQMLADAEAALGTEDLDTAANLFLEVAQANPTEYRALQGMTRSSLFLGMVDEAQEYIKAALKVDPEQGLSHTLQGLLFEAQGNLVGGLVSLKKGAELDEDSFLAQFNLGRVEAQLQNYEPAKAALLKATKLAPDNFAAFLALGIACKESDDFDNAIRSFNRAVELAPNNLDLYVILADVLAMSGDGETAMEALNTAMNRFGEHPALLEKASGISMVFGHFDAAKDFTEKLVKVMPDYETGWLNLANFCLMTEDLERSEAAAKQVLEINPNNWEAYLHLGNLYDVLKLKEQAKEMYLKGIDISPNYDLLNNLGALLLESDETSDREEGVAILSEAVNLAPEGNWKAFYNLALGYASLNEKSRARELLASFKNEVDKDSDLGKQIATLDGNLLSESDKIKLNISQWKV